MASFSYDDQFQDFKLNILILHPYDYLITGSVQSRWAMANFEPHDIKIPEFFKF